MSASSNAMSFSTRSQHKQNARRVCSMVIDPKDDSSKEKSRKNDSRDRDEGRSERGKGQSARNTQPSSEKPSHVSCAKKVNPACDKGMKPCAKSAHNTDSVSQASCSVSKAATSTSTQHSTSTAESVCTAQKQSASHKTGVEQNNEGSERQSQRQYL